MPSPNTLSPLRNRKRSSATATAAFTSDAATAAAQLLLTTSCACELESFVTVLPVLPQQDHRRGILRFIGPTDFADGVWVGVELVGSFGRNDGSVKGRKYFQCLPGQGLFVRPDLVQPYVSNSGSSTAATMDEPALNAPPPLSSSEPPPAQSPRLPLSPSSDDLIRPDEVHRASVGIAEQQRNEIAALCVKLKAAEERCAVADAAALAATQLRTSGELDTLRHRLEEEERRRTATEAALTSAREGLRGAETRAAEALSGQQRSEQAASAMIEQVQSLKDQLREAQAQSEATQGVAAEAEELRRANVSLQAALTASVAEHERSMETQCAAADNINEKAQRLQREETASATEQLQRELEGLRAQAVAREEAHREQEEILQRTKSELSTLQGERAALLTRMEALSHAVPPVPEQQQQQQFAESRAAGLPSMQLEQQMAELQELYGLLEEELEHERQQSDTLTRALEVAHAEREKERNAFAEQKSSVDALLESRESQLRDATRRSDQLEAQLSESSRPLTDAATTLADAEAGDPCHASALSVAQLSNDLDAARLRIFQLTKDVETTTHLQVRCDELGRENDALRGRHRKREQDITAEYEAAMDPLRRARDASQAACEAAQAELTAAREQQNKGTRSSLLSAVERGLYERSLASLQLELLKWRASGASADSFQCPSLHLFPSLGGGLPIRDRCLTLARRTEAEVAAVRQQWSLESNGGSVTHVLDFSTPEARAVSTLALFSAPRAIHAPMNA